VGLNTQESPFGGSLRAWTREGGGSARARAGASHSKRADLHTHASLTEEDAPQDREVRRKQCVLTHERDPTETSLSRRRARLLRGRRTSSWLITSYLSSKSCAMRTRCGFIGCPCSREERQMQREVNERGPDTSAVQLLYATCVYTAYKCANRAGAPQRRKPVAWRLLRQGWRPRETEGQTLSHLSVVVVAHLRIIEVRDLSLLRHTRRLCKGSHSTQGFFPRPRDSPAAAPAAGPATLCSTLTCTSPTCPARRFLHSVHANVIQTQGRDVRSQSPLRTMEVDEVAEKMHKMGRIVTVRLTRDSRARSRWAHQTDCT